MTNERKINNSLSIITVLLWVFAIGLVVTMPYWHSACVLMLRGEH